MNVVLTNGWSIDSLSGVWILGGTFIAYCAMCLAIAFGRNRYQSWKFKKAREARQKYYLTMKKEAEGHENHN